LAVAPERIVGAPVGREAPEKFLVVPLHFLKCPLSGGAQQILFGSARLRRLVLKTG